MDQARPMSWSAQRIQRNVRDPSSMLHGKAMHRLTASKTEVVDPMAILACLTHSECVHATPGDARLKVFQSQTPLPFLRNSSGLAGQLCRACSPSCGRNETKVQVYLDAFLFFWV